MVIGQGMNGHALDLIDFNPEFMGRLNREGIEPVAECMLVLLNDGEY